MGFNWALYFAQSAVLRQVHRAPEMKDTATIDQPTTAAVLGKCHDINVGVIGHSIERVLNACTAATDSLDAVGLHTHESTGS